MFLNELERCYYADTCKIANYTLNYINNMIFFKIKYLLFHKTCYLYNIN